MYKPVKPGLSSTCFHCLAHEVRQPSFFDMPMLLTSLCNHRAQIHSGTINTTFGHVVHLPLLPLVLIFALCLTLVSNSIFSLNRANVFPQNKTCPSKASNKTAYKTGTPHDHSCLTGSLQLLDNWTDHKAMYKEATTISFGTLNFILFLLSTRPT